MNAKKTAENRFLDKIVGLYMRLLEEKDSEHEARAQVEQFIRRALNKLGFKGTAEKLERRAAQLMALAEQRAKANLERKDYLLELKLGEGSGSYSVSFLSGVRIPNTPGNVEAWKAFLGTLAPKTRIGPDPATGEVGILYRDGTWLGDLMLADDVRSLNVTPQVEHVRGDLVARGARVVNKAFSHKLHVGGDLIIHHDLLRQDPPPIRFDGGMRLTGIRSLLDAPFPPERLTAWGLTPGASLCIRSDSFTLREQSSPGRKGLYLRGENVLANYDWRDGKWIKSKQERVSETTFEATHAKLNRLCLELSLGSNFIAKSVSRVPDNIDRIVLYLDFVLAAAAKPHGQDDPEADGARALTAALLALRTPYREKRVDEDAARAALENITDADRDRAVALALRPRRKLGEKLVQADLDRVLDLLDREPVPLELLGDGPGAVAALTLALRSQAMHDNLEQALAPLKKAFDEASAGLDSDRKPDFAAFLDAPQAAMETLREIARVKGARFNAAALEAELRELSNATPKEIVRRVASVPYSEAGEDFAADKTLLRTLFEATPDGLADQPFDAPTMLAFLVPGMRSVAAPRLREAQRSMVRAEEPDDPLAAVLARTFSGLPPHKLAAAVRNWLRMHLEVVRKFNELGAIDYGTAREAEREEKTTAMIGLPPEVTREINQRLGRMCLLTGLGRGFIETGDAALEDNLRKLAHYLAVALAITPGSPKPLLADEERKAVSAVHAALLTLAQSLDTGDSEAAAEALGMLSEKILGVLAAILAKPRNPADTKPLARDVAYLDGLRNTRTSMKDVFKEPGRLLLFANSCMESKEMKKAISTAIKPLYFALSGVGSQAGGVTANELLKNSCAPEGFLNRLGAAGHDAAARKIEKALKDICDKSIEDVASDLRKSAKGAKEGALGRDREFLGRILALDGQAFGTLQLDEKRTALLLLTNLDSHIAGWVKDRFEAGRFAGRTAPQIVRRTQDRAKWELAVLKTYNTLTTRPR